MLLTIPELKKAYIDTGLVRYVYKDFPLAFHPHAHQAAVAARCAGAQGDYWGMHDTLFYSQSAWVSLEDVTPTFVSFAQALKLDTRAFQACLESGQFDNEIAADVQAAKAAGVSGTPSFLVNGQLLVGAYPYKEFQRRIDAALENAK